VVVLTQTRIESFDFNALIRLNQDWLACDVQDDARTQRWRNVGGSTASFGWWLDTDSLF
jgi:hypothetical protein